jgi:hypothetical protein
MKTDSTYLCNSYGYTKGILTDQKAQETFLINEIKLACRKQGYILLEITIQPHENLYPTTDQGSPKKKTI